MILHFTDRKFNIITVASTSLPDGIVVTEDLKTQEVDTGIASLSFRIPYNRETRAVAERAATAGNYVLRGNGEDNECFTIIDSELDTGSQTVFVYAEDAGLDLLNKVALIWPTSATPASEKGAHTLAWYFNYFLRDSDYSGGSAGGGSTGFELGRNQAGTGTKTLTWDSEETLTARLLSVAQAFDCEIAFRFIIEGLAVTHRYVDVYKKRGSDNGIKLRQGIEVSGIRIKKSIADIATALKCTGAESGGVRINLEGYSFDDGEFYVAPGSLLCSRTAKSQWAAYGDIVKAFSYDTVEQAALCQQAISELKRIRNGETTYEADLNYIPDDLRIGDTVTLIDDEAELYVTARILKLEESEYDDKRTVTLGEFAIRKSGIAQEVSDLAKQFETFSKNRPFYTWTAYADDNLGTGISLDPEGKAYIGTASNKTTSAVDISDPSVFTWVKAKGEKGEDAVVLRIDSSRGTVFKNNSVSTVLTVAIYTGGQRITNITDLRAKFGQGAYLQWYWQRLDEDRYGVISSDDHKLSNDGFSLTLTPEEVDTKVTFMCELIAD